jgi:hypothetical protein
MHFPKNGIDKLHLLNNLIEFCLDYSVVFNDAVCYGLPILIVRKIQILELGQEELPRSTFIVWDSVNQSVDEFFSSIQRREALQTGVQR